MIGKDITVRGEKPAVNSELDASVEASHGYCVYGIVKRRGWDTALAIQRGEVIRTEMCARSDYNSSILKVEGFQYGTGVVLDGRQKLRFNGWIVVSALTLSRCVGFSHDVYSCMGSDRV